MENISSIGKIIKTLLAECKIDEITLAKHVSMPKSTLNRLINHDSNPTLDTLKPIAEFFAITVKSINWRESLT